MTQQSSPRQTRAQEQTSRVLELVAGPLVFLLDRVFGWLMMTTQRLAKAHSSVGDKTFFDAKAFPWTRDIERDWPKVRGELDRLLNRLHELPNFQDISPEQRAITDDDDWKIYLLRISGRRFEQNCRSCPDTAALLDRIPGLTTAFFSILSPGKQIPEHRGPYAGVLRYHLGLVVPDDRERCWIRVGDDRASWEEGKGLIFDDTHPHEVCNDTHQMRVVLFVDFKRPLPFLVAVLNELVLWLASKTPYVRNGIINEQEWEKRFYR